MKIPLISPGKAGSPHQRIHLEKRFYWLLSGLALLFVLFYTSAVVTAPLTAQTSVEGANLVEVPVSTAKEWQAEADVVYNPARQEYFVVWQDRRSYTHWDIRGRRVSPEGQLLSGEIIICGSAHDQRYPQIAYNAKDKEYLVVWHHRQSGYLAIYGQRVSANGSLIGGRFTIPGGGNSQWIPTVTYNTRDNEYLVAWKGTSGSCIYAQRVNANGGMAGRVISVACNVQNQWRTVHSAYNRGRNEYLLVWDKIVAGESNVYGQRLAANGERRGGIIPIVEDQDQQYVAGVACDDLSNRYLVAWNEVVNRAVDIRGRLVAGNGSLIGDTFVVYENKFWQYANDVLYSNQTRQYVVVWADGNAGGNENNIRGQRLSADGERVGGIMYIKGNPANQQRPCIAWDSHRERCFIVWQDWRNHVNSRSPNADIYGQVYAPPAVGPSATPTATPTGPTPTPSKTFTYTATPTVTDTSPPTYTPTGTQSPTRTFTPVPRTIYCYRWENEPYLDGKLDDWTSGGRRWIGEGAADSIGREELRGQSDLSANVWARWDDRNVYLAVAVHDADLVMDSGDALWHDDSLELSLDGAYDQLSGGPDDHRYTLRIDETFWHFGSGYQPRPAVLTSTHGYTVEMVIPIDLLTLSTPASDLTMGINLGFHDDDDGGDYDTYLVWSQGSTSDAEHFGRLIFQTGEPAATDTPTAIANSTNTATSTVIPTGTPTSTVSSEQSPTPTDTAVATATLTWTDTPTATWTDTATATWTWTATDTWTPTNSPTSSPTATWTPSPTWTPTFTGTPTATDTPTITMTPAPITVRLPLRQGQNGYQGAKDTYLTASEPETEAGAKPRLLLQNDEHKILLHWDLSRVPANAQVERAWFGLRIRKTAGQALDVYRVLRPWSEREATWQQARDGRAWDVPGCSGPGTDRAAEPLRSVRIEGGDLYRAINITELVQDWIQHPNRNHGLLVESGGSDSGKTLFMSADNATLKKRPLLVVRYQALPTPTPTPTLPAKVLDCYPLENTISIDGNLSDWSSEGTLLVSPDNADTVGPMGAAFDGLADLSAKVRSRWDADNVYFGFHVKDDRLISDDPAAVWHDDGIELALDGAYDRRFDGLDDLRYAISVDGRQVAVGTAPGLVSAVSRFGDGYDIEIGVPRARLTSGMLHSNLLMGVNLGFHDDDDGGDYDLYAVWAGNDIGDASQFGALRFRDGTAATATPTVVSTPTRVATATATQTNEPAPTATDTPIPTQPLTSTPTHVPTATETWTSIPTDTRTSTPSRTRTATPTTDVTPVTKSLVLRENIDGYQGFMDTYIDAWYSTTNRGDDTRLVVRTGDIRSALMRIDLSHIPQDAEITEATLALYTISPTGHPIEVSAYQVLKPWQASQATWYKATHQSNWGQAGCNKIGEDRLGQAADTAYIDRGTSWYEFDLTTLAQTWVADPGSNQGLLLKGTSHIAAEYVFASSDEWVPELRPQLTLSYRLGGGAAPTATSTATRTLPATATSTAPASTATYTPTPTVAETNLSNTSLVLQAGLDGYQGAADTYLSSWMSGENYGLVTSLKCRSDDAFTSLLQFDLGRLPDNARISEAFLELYTTGAGRQPIDVQVYEVIRPWAEGAATWQKATNSTYWGAPGCNSLATDRAVEPVASQEVGAERTWYTFDVTTLLEKWHARPATNHGLVVKGQGDVATAYRFASSEHWSQHWRPKLTIHYATESVLTTTDSLTRSPGLADVETQAELSGHFPPGYPTVVPVMYVMFDYHNRDYQKERPDYGPLGSWMWWTWDQIHVGPGQYDWSAIDNYLARAASMRITLPSGEEIPKPVAISIEVFPDVGRDQTPEWLYRRYIPNAPQISRDYVGYSQDLDGEGGCDPIGAPRWGDAVWEEHLTDLVMALGERYNDDPRVNSVWICSGLYGELISTCRYCGRTYNFDRGGEFGRWVLRLMDTYREAFPTKPLYIINSGRSYERYATTERAKSYHPKMGVKHNTLNYDLPNEYGEQSTAGFGLMETINPISTTVPIAFEHFFAASPHQTYWATMNGLAHHADLFDFPYYPYQFHIFDQIASLKNLLHGYDHWDFIDRYLGQSVKSTPGVWVMFRDTQWPADVTEWNGEVCVPRLWEHGEDDKDWEYWLYNLKVPGGETAELVRPLHMNKDHPECSEAANLRFDAEMPDDLRQQIYGYYALRRTDQSNGQRYFYLDVDDSWTHWGRVPAAADGNARYKLTVVYADLGTDSWALVYKTHDGTTKTKVVEKTNSPKWKSQTWYLDDLYLHDGFSQGEDFRLDSLSNGDDYFHLVHLEIVEE